MIPKFLGSCKWEGKYEHLFLHCTDIHPDLTYNNLLIEINIISSSENNYVFRQANETFIAQLKSDTNELKFYCNVRYCGLESAAKQFSYRLCFLGKKKKYACQVHSVQPGEIGPIITENTTVANFDDILENLNFSSWITCRVDIFVKRISNEVEVAVPRPTNSILKKLECPICLEYMVPPIMQCNVGHSFCQSCKNQLTDCPTCKGPINDTRNYLLEDITAVIEYPCKYTKYGCQFLGNAENIKNHQSTCECGPYKCFVENCFWEGKQTEVINHLNEAHKENILEADMVTWIIDYTVTRESFDYIIIRKDNVFKIEFVRDCLNFSWTLYSTDVTKDCSRFMFVMDFSSQFEERLHIQKREIPSLVHFDMNQLENFIEDDVLIYKIQLIETL